jgi:hypothetical protein
MALLSELEALDPRLRALALPRIVEVISDDALVEKVEKGNLEGAKASIETIPQAHGPELVVPAEILMELAWVSSPASTIASFGALSLQWAWLRYFWAFEGDRPYSMLRLSKAAMKQARHHKGITSEQLGIGFAIQLVRRVLNRLHPQCTTEVHDADVVIDGGPPATWGLRSTTTDDLRPDYFIEVLDPKSRPGEPPSALYILECKGTFSNGHLRQIRKGLRQVNSVEDSSGNPFPGIVCSASFDGKVPVTLRVLDPGDGPEFIEPAPPEDGEAEIGKAGHGFRISGEGPLRRELAQLRRARALSFAGDYEEAQRVAPPRIVRRAAEHWPPDEETRGRAFDDRKPERRENLVANRPTRGVSASLALLDGSQLTIGTEMDDAILRAAADRDADIEKVRGQFAKALDLFEKSDPRRQAVHRDAEEWVPNLETESVDHLRVISRKGEVLDLKLT